MAARSPRRTFATPFVVTLAAPLLAACHAEPAPPSPHADPAIVANPPRPTQPPSDPPTSPDGRTWTVMKEGAKLLTGTATTDVFGIGAIER